MTVLVCFSGQIGSGKSSVSVAVATALGWSRTGFGDYLRAQIVQAGGDPHSRETLQDLGQRLVEADPEEFCRSVLNDGGFRPGEDFLIDGVRLPPPPPACSFLVQTKSCDWTASPTAPIKTISFAQRRTGLKQSCVTTCRRLPTKSSMHPAHSAMSLPTVRKQSELGEIREDQRRKRPCKL